MKITPDKYVPDPNSGCWLWLGAVDSSGYGNVSKKKANGKWGNIGAHKASYLENVGDIPAGLEVKHSCDVRCCVNPDHLSVGTHSSNVAEAVHRGKMNKKLTAAQREEIIAADGLHKDIAKLYGVSRVWVTKLKSL